jgi:hypothetical protein
MAVLNYCCYKCIDRPKPTFFKRCMSCSRFYREKHICVKRTNSKWALPRFLHFCPSCASTYHEAKNRMDEFAQSRKYKLWHVVEGILSAVLVVSVVGIPIAVIWWAVA